MVVWNINCACCWLPHAKNITCLKRSLCIACILCVYHGHQTFNPLTTVAISKLLTRIGRSAYFLLRLDRDRSTLGYKPDYRHGWLSEYVRKLMHARNTVCLLRIGQPRRPGEAAKSSQFEGQFSWDKYVQRSSKGYKHYRRSSLLSAPVRSNGDRLCFATVYFFYFFLFTVRSQKLLDRFSPNFQGLCILV